MLSNIIDYTTIALTVGPLVFMFIWLLIPSRRIRIRSTEDGHRGVVDIRSHDGHLYRCCRGVCKRIEPAYEETNKLVIQVEPTI